MIDYLFSSTPNANALRHPPSFPMSRSLSVAPRALALSAALLVALTGCGAKSSGNTESSAASKSPAAVAPPTAASAAGTAASGSPEADARVLRADQSRILGDSTAKLWMLVVSDFQCPFCGQWERETASAVIDEYVKTGKVRLAFINYPLQIHPNAFPAAEAAMCAGAQGKFWEMHGRIFAKQQEWSQLQNSVPFFETMAGEVVPDLAAYRTCVADHVMRPMIEADADRARAAGARSTPTFFIGNQMMAGAERIEKFRSVIATAMSELPK